MNNKEMNKVTEQNKKLQRYVVEEIWNTGDLEKVDAIVSSEFVIHFPTPGEDLRGAEEIKQFFSHLRSAFPDIQFTIINQIAEGDQVVTHWTATGTHKGEFKGIPPSGNKVNFSAVDIDKIVNGKFIECWTVLDELNLMQQIDAIPSVK
jgi:steroid delta-isomerase-like uncharacterized protein